MEIFLGGEYQYVTQQQITLSLFMVLDLWGFQLDRILESWQGLLRPAA